MNVKKTKSSKKIVLKIIMSMTESGLVRTSQRESLFLSPPAHAIPKALYLGAEDLTLIHQGVDIHICLFLEPSQSSQGRMVVVKTTAVPVPSGIEGRHHGLLIHNKVGNHPFDPSHPPLQFGLLCFQTVPLEQC